MTIWILTRTMPVISTGHLTADTRQRFDSTPVRARPLPTYDGEYGWIVHVGTDPLTEDSALFRRAPPDLFACLVWAQANGYAWVEFDADGGVVTELPFFEEE